MLWASSLESRKKGLCYSIVWESTQRENWLSYRVCHIKDPSPGGIFSPSVNRGERPVGESSCWGVVLSREQESCDSTYGSHCHYDWTSFGRNVLKMNVPCGDERSICRAPRLLKWMVVTTWTCSKKFTSLSVPRQASVTNSAIFGLLGSITRSDLW